MPFLADLVYFSLRFASAGRRVIRARVSRFFLTALYGYTQHGAWSGSGQWCLSPHSPVFGLQRVRLAVDALLHVSAASALSTYSCCVVRVHGTLVGVLCLYLLLVRFRRVQCDLVHLADTVCLCCQSVFVLRLVCSRSLEVHVARSVAD